MLVTLICHPDATSPEVISLGTQGNTYVRTSLFLMYRECFEQKPIAWILTLTEDKDLCLWLVTAYTG